MSAVRQQITQPEPDWIDDMNAKYAVVSMGGKMMVAHREHNHDLGQKVWNTFSFQSFKDSLVNKYVTVAVGNKQERVHMAPKWLTDERRSGNRQFVLDSSRPSGLETAGYVNLWGSFNVNLDLASQGEAETIIGFIREALASNNETNYQYIIKWLAHCVQNPDKVPGVALVLRGHQGTGKGLLGRLMVSLFGDNGLQIARPEHAVGKFNAHLRQTCFLFADEAFFAGNRQDVGPLKALITEPTMVIEKKGVDALSVANHVSVLMATNNEFAVPATKEERRFALFQTNDELAKHPEYFAPIYRWVEIEANRAAFLKYLLDMDLNAFNVRVYPITDGLRDQHREMLDPIARWWMSVLQDGYLGYGWPNEISTKDAHYFLMQWAKDSRLDQYELKACSTTALGLYLNGDSKLVVGKKRSPIGKREYFYRLLDLDESRAAFIAKHGLSEELFND